MMGKTNKTKVEPLALINDEPVAALTDDRLGLHQFANTVAAVVLGTEGPFTVGVFGDWGHGKTSMLKLAQTLVEDSKSENVTTVWFNAWQYEKEEHPIVPLTATIIRVLEEKLARKMSKKFKKFNKALVRALRAALYGSHPRFGAMIDRDEKLKRQSVDPLLNQSLYYNAFRLLAGLNTGGTSKDRPRIIVFIDDLDRCLPENALHLLESIKLVLAQPGFIFVLAVDRRIVEGYLDHRYKEKYGIEDYGQGRSYLDKIIQLPFHIPTHEDRFANFVRLMLLREEMNELIEDFEPLTDLIGHACNFNPREVVRFFNGMLVARHIWSQVNPKEPFDAGAFAVARSLQNQSDNTYRTLMKNPDFCAALNEAGVEVFDRLQAIRSEVSAQEGKLEEPVFGIYYWSGPFSLAIKDLLDHSHLCKLLDTEPGRRWLSQIELRTQIEQFLRVQRPETTETSSGRIIETAIRKAINKQEGQLTEEDRKGIDELDLTGEPITDLEAITGLANLRRLYLDGTQVGDLGPITGLTNLRHLFFKGTQVNDLGPITRLANLEKLHLSRTQVSDLGPIKVLTNLQGLSLSSTQVSDLGPIKGLANLQTLNLSSTRVSDLGPIKGLANLQGLDLDGTQVSDLGPTTNLANLQTLSLNGTQVSDLEPITGLANLQELYLNGTPVNDEQVAALRAALPNVHVIR